ncbi:MAG: hypothetical protein JST44_19165 [Cyanobacteria bacterium SZAS LIN-5]|nr:hypothetical protein [Cyanobacteria bacterium SZAS LIN-5]
MQNKVLVHSTVLAQNIVLAQNKVLTLNDRGMPSAEPAPMRPAGNSLTKFPTDPKMCFIEVIA